ncbi:MAG: hypothetical protein QM796_22770 [Chthoniobacteraceae bacterium]
MSPLKTHLLAALTSLVATMQLSRAPDYFQLDHHLLLQPALGGGGECFELDGGDLRCGECRRLGDECGWGRQ